MQSTGHTKCITTILPVNSVANYTKKCGNITDNTQNFVHRCLSKFKCLKFSKSNVIQH